MMPPETAPDLTEDELADLKASHTRTQTANTAGYSGPSCAACDDMQPMPCKVTRLIQMYERLSRSSGRVDAPTQPTPRPRGRPRMRGDNPPAPPDVGVS